MGVPTSVTCTLDDSDYCRYEDDHKVMTATIVATGGTPYTADDNIVVSLRKARRSRDAIVAQKTLTLSGSSPVELTATFDLSAIVDQDQINLVRYGKYFVYAEYPAVSATATIAGGIITIAVDDAGTDGNAYTVQVVVPAGTSPLSANLTGTVLTVSLETVGGVPEGGLINNTARITAIINAAQTYLTASYTGAGSDPVILAEGPTAFTGGTEAVTAESDDVTVHVMSLARFKKDFLFGLELRATEIKSVKQQPQAITGVEVVEVSKSHLEGFGTLTYNYFVDGANTIRTLSWNGGPVQYINSPGTFILQSGTGTTPFALSNPLNSTSYISVKVKSQALLPTVNMTETLLVEKQVMDDTTIRNALDRATMWLEQDALNVFIEPTNVVTEPDPTVIDWSAGVNISSPILTDSDYDFIVSPLSYLVPAGGYHNWVWIQTPYNSILRVDSLYGAIANTRIIDIDLEWIHHSIEGGFIQLVPYNQETAFDFLGLIWVNSIRGATELPNFWHFNMIVGLRDCTPDIQEIIAKKAAIDVLTVAGQAFRPGVGSISLGRDGVSESVSYTNTGQYGLFNGIIQNYKEQVESQLKQLRANYKGANMVVV